MNQSSFLLKNFLHGGTLKKTSNPLKLMYITHLDNRPSSKFQGIYDALNNGEPFSSDDMQTPILLADFSWWNQLEMWTPSQAVALSLGLNPIMFTGNPEEAECHITFDGLDPLLKEYNKRIITLMHSKIISNIEDAELNRALDQKIFIDYFSNAYRLKIPLALWSDNILAEQVIDRITTGARDDTRLQIERFNFFLNVMLYRNEVTIGYDGKARGTCQQFVKRYENFLKPYLDSTHYEFSRFCSKEQKKTLRETLALKGKTYLGNKNSWQHSWESAGIHVRPIEFSSDDES